MSMRPVLETKNSKKDGRRKMCLVLQGLKEPLEWDLESNMSPVAQTSSARMLVYAAGCVDDVISCIDVSVAFLQADEYGPEDRPRYVSLRAYPGAKKYVLQCRGPIYGIRSASRAWHRTIAIVQWLVSDMGYEGSTDESSAVEGGAVGSEVDGAIDGAIDGSGASGVKGTGYGQGSNEPCLFVHPVTGHKVNTKC